MGKILVIDDDGMNLKMASFILAKAGYEAVTATSGTEGIGKLQEEIYDLVLLDIEMPEMSGVETLEQIRANGAIADTKVCFLTGTIDEQVEADAERLGALKVIGKPFKAPELMAEVKAIVG